MAVRCWIDSVNRRLGSGAAGALLAVDQILARPNTRTAAPFQRAIFQRRRTIWKSASEKLLAQRHVVCSHCVLAAKRIQTVRPLRALPYFVQYAS